MTETYKKCLKLIKKMNGVMLNELETQDILNFQDDEVWKKYPHPATAADFLKTNAITKEAGCTICIGIKNDKFIIFKNINDQSTKNWSGTIEELYELLKNKKEWFRSKPKRLKSFEIAGKYKDRFIIMRCCDEGEWYISFPIRGSGALSCKHDGSQTFYDYLDVDKLKEVTDEKILKEVEASESYKLYNPANHY